MFSPTNNLAGAGKQGRDRSRSVLALTWLHIGISLTSNTTFTGIRLADKRSLPCPKRLEWLSARDDLYEQIMNKAWYPEGEYFGQSYEEPEVLDSSLMIMPLVFFSTPVSYIPSVRRTDSTADNRVIRLTQGFWER